MKLRINGNSIRLRLGQSEVRRLAADGLIEESTAFGPLPKEHFRYSICNSSDCPDITASFTNHHLVIHVPFGMLQQWASTDQIGIHALQRTGTDELHILIEKDFECIDAPPGELQEDAFPHPQLIAACGPAQTIGRPA
jgi:hypothetical protein